MYEVYNRPVVHPFGDASKSRNGSFISSGTQTTEGTGKRILRKQRRLTFHSFRSTTMNTLNLIKKQIDKAAALHDAQIHVTKYRGVDCKVHEAPEETHGTYCYRGRTYVK